MRLCWMALLTVWSPEQTLQARFESTREVLRPLFWDCDFDHVSWREHEDFVVRRVLSEGTWESVCWLRVQVGDCALRQWIERHRGRPLSRQQLRFWELVLDLPSGLVDAWLASEGRKIWEGRTRP